MLLYFVFPTIALSETCLIDCRANTGQVGTVSDQIETLLSASKGGFSVSFNETCDIVAPWTLADATFDSEGYFEYRLNRLSNSGPLQKYHGVCGNDMTTSFAYLNSSQSGAISNREYTYTCATDKYFPDGSYTPQPDTRTQTCVYGLRLTPAVTSKFGAAFWSQKQKVIYGFDTTFHFRVLHQSRLCALQFSPNAERWCYDRGGRGFAFVIQNEGSPGVGGTGDTIGYKISAQGRVNLGYSFARNLAIEFDYYLDDDSNDPTWNHIAVMVPVSRKSSESDNANSADHKTNTLAFVEGASLPRLSEGTHKVRITYDVTAASKWQQLIGQWHNRPLTANQDDMLHYWSNNRPGLLSVFLNDVPVIRVLVDIAQVVQVDPVSTYEAVESTSPNAPHPGAAWVGFVAATGTDNVASPIILSWKFSTGAMCPGSSDGALKCTTGSKKGDTQSTAPRFTLRNVGRIDMRVMMKLPSVPPNSCTNNHLAWNQVHPYFLGCQRTVEVGPDLEQISITDAAGVRSVVVTDQSLIKRDYVGQVFLRRQMPEFCVTEHESDAYRLYFASCDCSFCSRVFDNQRLYSVFYSEICSQRYTYTCSCLEVSQMSSGTYYTDLETMANPWKKISQPGYSFQTKTMQFQRHSVCRGCKFDYHCSLMNKAALCDTPSVTYRVGNPLKPVIGGQFQNWNRGAGAEDGAIKGSACDCGDRTEEPPYLTLAGVPQTFDVFLIAYLQGTPAACRACLRIPGASCIDICGTPSQASYLHYPTGQACATCLFASASLLDVTTARQLKLRNCVYAAIQNGNDPWVACIDTVATWTGAQDAQTSLNSYLNGVATHFMSECPSREFSISGAVCAPNLFVKSIIPMQVLGRESALASTDGIYFPSWWDGVACLNAVCDLIPRVDCYEKIYKLVFEKQNDGTVICKDLLGSGIPCTLVNAPSFNTTSGSAVFSRGSQQYGYTGSLDKTGWANKGAGLKRKSFEVWAAIDPVDTVSDLVKLRTSVVTASSSWGDDYQPRLAVDGNLNTFWQSATSASASFTAQWGLDFGQDVQNAMGYTIKWAYRAVNYVVKVRIGSADWIVVDEVTENTSDTTKSNSFFGFTQLRIVMTLASQQRPTGQDQGTYTYGIKELTIDADMNIARFKPDEVVQYRNFGASLALDNDYGTWWSTPRESRSGSLSVSFGNMARVVSLIRIVFRRGFAPSTVALSLSTDAGATSTALTCTTVGCLASPSDSNFVYSFSTVSNSFTTSALTVLKVDVPQAAAYYDSTIVQIAEFEIYSPGVQNVIFRAGGCALTTKSGNSCPGFSRGVFPIILEAGSIGVFHSWRSSSALPAGSQLGIFSMRFQNSNSYPFSMTISSPSTTSILSADASNFGVKNDFALLVNDITDLQISIEVRVNFPCTITKMDLTPITKVDLSSIATGVPSAVWSETLPRTLPLQGPVANMVDGNEFTEFRTKLAAPSKTGAVSFDLDYIIDVTLGHHMSADLVFIDFSYLSQWFRLAGNSAISGGSSTLCEWTPELNDAGEWSTTSCDSTAISMVESGNYYQFTFAPDYQTFATSQRYGQSYVSSLQFTIVQASARDLIAGDAIIGVRELQVFSTFPVIPISTVVVDGYPSVANVAALTDMHFTNAFSITITGGGNSVKIILDLGSLKLVKHIEIWWSTPLITIPGNIEFRFSTNNAACQDYAAATYESLINVEVDNSSLSRPATLSMDTLDYIRCAEVSLVHDAAATHAQDFAVAEIVVKGRHSSYKSNVIASSLTNPAFALDAASATEAIAASAAGLEHYIMFDLSDALPVWGVSMWLTGNTGHMAATLYLCDSTAQTVVACANQGHSFVIPEARISYFVFGPPLECTNCKRVALKLIAAPLILGAAELFRLNQLSVFASANEAVDASVSLNDNRVWDYSIGKSNDGNSTTSWVSEPDVTGVDLKYSLIPNGQGYQALDPGYAATAAGRPPFHLSNITVAFKYPVLNFEIFTSLDGQVWAPYEAFANNQLMTVTVTKFALANFIKVSLETLKYRQDHSVTISTTADDQTWWSPIYGISEVSVGTLSTLQVGKAASASSTADPTQFSPISQWMAFPPSATAIYVVSPTQTTVSGIVIEWLLPPTAYVVKFGSQTVGYVTSAGGNTFISDPSVGTPKSTVMTATGLSLISQITLQATEFQTRNNVAVSVLKSITAYTPDIQHNLESADAPAYDDSWQYLIDGQTGGPNAYTSPADVPAPVSITFPVTYTGYMGKLKIFWKKVCLSFSVKAVLRLSAGSPATEVTVFSTTSNTGLTSEIFFALSVESIKLTLNMNADSSTVSFSIYEVQLFQAAMLPILSSVSDPPVSFAPSASIDTQSYSQWMAVPSAAVSPANPASLTVDLLNVYPVKSITVYHGWVPILSTWTDAEISGRRSLEISDDGNIFTAITGSFHYRSDWHADVCTSLLAFRYLRVSYKESFVDMDLDPTVSIFGPSIRDIQIIRDENIVKNAQDKAIPALGWWDFPPTKTADGLPTTGWLSQRGQSTADLVASLGSIYDVAGIDLFFRYVPAVIRFYASTDCAEYTLVSTVTGNSAAQVTLSGQTFQFQAKCVKISMASPLTRIANPDDALAASQFILGVNTLAIHHHVGGGGLLAIEGNVSGQWGSLFDSIAFSPFQPGQWNMLSNQQDRTQNANGPVDYDETSNLVHIVVTFSDDKVRIYRNGVLFGTPYTTTPLAWNSVSEVRLVFGVRSSAFVNASDATILNLMGTGPGDQISTLSPYFSGQIKSVALYSQALSHEEIEGLYLTPTGTRERGCHCYDACPVGRNRFFTDMDVPCSGQGVCTRRYHPITGIPTTGVCVCSPGFSGANCATHCSNSGGCCSLDDDCPMGTSCDTTANRCV